MGEVRRENEGVEEDVDEGRRNRKKDDEDKKIFVYHRGHINAGYTLNGERKRER